MTQTLTRGPVWTALEVIMHNAGDNTATLGKKAGLTQSCVWQVIYGTRRGKPETVRRIAAVYGMTWSQLNATRTPGTDREVA